MAVVVNKLGPRQREWMSHTNETSQVESQAMIFNNKTTRMRMNFNKCRATAESPRRKVKRKKRTKEEEYAASIPDGQSDNQQRRRNRSAMNRTETKTKRVNKELNNRKSYCYSQPPLKKNHALSY